MIDKSENHILLQNNILTNKLQNYIILYKNIFIAVQNNVLTDQLQNYSFIQEYQDILYNNVLAVILHIY